MKILSIDETPTHEWPYLRAAPGGGTDGRVILMRVNG
jgi:hypothetical protein